MNGDGMNGLALAIFIAMVVLGLGPALVLGLIGRRLFRTPGLVIGVIVGAIVGPLIAIATFLESTWSPPIELNFTGAAHKSVVLVRDPDAAPILVIGPNVPFVTRRVFLDVPKKGVVHVRDLTPLQTEVVEAFFNNNRATGAISNADMLAYDFGDPDFDKIDPVEREAPPPYPVNKVLYGNQNPCQHLVYKRGCSELRKGRVSVRVTIDADGHFQRGELLSNSISRDPELVAKCILDMLPTWNYVAPGESPPTFEMTFILSDKC